MKKFHFALAMSNIPISVHEYSQQLGQSPDLIIPDHYALWRTTTRNFFICTSSNAPTQPLRHLGWEGEEIDWSSVEEDSKVIALECVTARQQSAGIAQDRPDGSYHPILD